MDALKAAILQVALGNTSDTKVRGFNANAIIIRPEDATNMELERVSGSNNQYIIPPFMSADGRMISGVPIYTSLFLSDDTFLVGDFSRTKLWTRQETVINIWDQNSTDAIYGLKTITATKRVALQTKEVDKYAFVTGTFTAAIAAITS